VAHAAERLDLSRSFVYELVKRGELRAVHVGSKLHIPKSELLRWIAERLEGGDGNAA
jgi:excisionase family DNA binding protein